MLKKIINLNFNIRYIKSNQILFFLLKMNILQKGISNVKGRMEKADIQRKLNEATSNENCFANISLMNEIADRTDSSEECKIILKHCLKMLTLKPKFWRRIQKSLALIEHIVKTGSSNFLDGIKEERDKLKDLYDFSYEEDGKDKGDISKFIIIFIINLNINFSKTKITIYS